MLEASSFSFREVEAAPSGVLTLPQDAQHDTHQDHGAQLDSRHLLQGQREVLIRHGGECYRLRHTRNGKLILTK